MGKLSIFVDESGDFGAYSVRSAYYIVSMIFHEQDNGLLPNMISERFLQRIINCFRRQI